MARKGKPWGPSNPLWRWQHRRRGSRRRSSGGSSSRAHRRARRARAAPGRRHFSMARRHRRRGSTKIPIVSLAILGAQALAANAEGSDWRAKLSIFASFYAGLDANDGQFHAERLLIGYCPWAAQRSLVTLAVRPRL